MNNYFGAVSGSWDLLGRRHQCHWNPKRWGVAYLSSSSNSLSSTCHVTFIFYDSPSNSRMLQLSTSQSTFQITGFNLLIQNSRLILATMFLLKDNHWSFASDQQSLEWMRPILRAISCKLPSPSSSSDLQIYSLSPKLHCHNTTVTLDHNYQKETCPPSSPNAPPWSPVSSSPPS